MRIVELYPDDFDESNMSILENQLASYIVDERIIYSIMELGGNKIMNVALLLVATLLVAKLISTLIIPRSKKCLPPVIKAWPIVGGLICFLKGPVVMLRQESPKRGSVFTLNLLNKNIIFFIDPEVSAHFFKAPETDLRS
ncbi:hypothetical protein H5410_015625 [Solanum commersonii]|uniref:Uncharacterized protein n=1 Tax=Solanum commersonii TaxID=4109 RepID=A0A9J5ZU98_SOLCO|nr:hypothetical protein H5410_015625 [Solanum commersonii]